jgi:hypothetical protein
MTIVRTIGQTIRRAASLLPALLFSLPAAAKGEVVRIHDLAPGQLARRRSTSKAGNHEGHEEHERNETHHLIAQRQRACLRGY